MFAESRAAHRLKVVFRIWEDGRSLGKDEWEDEDEGEGEKGGKWEEGGRRSCKN